MSYDSKPFQPMGKQALADLINLARAVDAVTPFESAFLDSWSVDSVTNNQSGDLWLYMQANPEDASYLQFAYDQLQKEKALVVQWRHDVLNAKAHFMATLDALPYLQLTLLAA